MRKSRGDKTRIVPITDEMLNKLLDLKEATGRGYHALYTYGRKQTDHEVFKKTTLQLPYSWAKGLTKTLNIDYYNAIVETYQSIPRNSAKHRIVSLQVPDSFKDDLERFVNKPRQLSLKKILEYADAPKGINPVMICHVISGRKQSINAEHLDFLKRLIKR